MGIILTLLVGTKHIIANSIRWHESSFEHAIMYDRRDGKRVEMALTHLPDISGEGQRAPTLQLCTRKTTRNERNAFNEYISFSMEEARLLRNLLNRPEVSAWLEEEAQ